MDRTLRPRRADLILLSGCHSARHAASGTVAAWLTDLGDDPDKPAEKA